MGQIAEEHGLIREPPTGLIESIRYMGPGLILSAAIVGSGELIATTALGAKVGFTFLWVILIGCAVKVTVQVEFGRHSILTGKPSFQAWNEEPNRRILGLHWSLLIALLFMISQLAGIGGVIGGAAQVAQSVFPALSLKLWVVVLILLAAFPLFRGAYGVVEAGATTLNLLFVTAVIYCVVAVQNTGYAFGLREVTEGFSLNIAWDALPLAIGAFGITGISAGEIFVYPSWCLEKGYARWTGPADGTEGWARRARGWIRVMTMDAVVAMVVYTLTTCAFYLLGASVLHAQEKLADGNQLVEQLSVIFTEVLGQEAWLIFMFGAFAVLFSTVFSNTAGYARLWTDFFTEARILRPNSIKQRQWSIAIMTWVLPTIWGLVYLGFQRPLFLVILMGIANSAFLLVVAFKALVFRYRKAEFGLTPSRRYDAFLWTSILAIVLLSLWALYGTVAPGS